MNDALLVVIALGVLAGGSIIVIDSFIIRRIRRRDDTDQDGAQR